MVEDEIAERVDALDRVGIGCVREEEAGVVGGDEMECGGVGPELSSRKS